MDDRTKQLKGSPKRDEFKQKHKELSSTFYACDLDFVLVEKVPTPDIVCAIDFKGLGDPVTFAEVIAYNALVRRGIAMYIVEGDVEACVFRISRYIGGHHSKPSYTTQHVATTASWDEFGQWEESVRKAYRKTFGG